MGLMKKRVSVGIFVMSSLCVGVACANSPYNSLGGDTGHHGYDIGVDIAPTFYVNKAASTSTIDTSNSYRAHAGIKQDAYTLETAFWFNNSNSWSGQGKGATLLFGNAYYNMSLSHHLIAALGGGLGWLHGLNTPAGDKSDNHMAYQGIVSLDYLIRPDLSLGTSYHLISWTKNNSDYAHAVNLGVSYHF